MERDYTIDAPAFGITAGTAAYILGAITSAAVPVDIIDITIGCDAVATGLLKVELITWTTDGTGSAYTPKAANGEGLLAAATTTAKIDYTVAPSGTITVEKTWMFPLPLGGFEVQLPLGRENSINVSTKFGLRVTSTTVSPNVYANLAFEE